MGTDDPKREEGSNDGTKDEKRRWELLRKLFWLAMIAATVGITWMAAGVALPASPQKDSSGTGFEGLLERLLHRITGADHPGASLLFLGLIVLLGFVLMLVLSGDPFQSLRNVLGPLLFGTIVMGLGAYLLPAKTLWGWLLAAIPAVMVLHHALYLGIIKPRFIKKASGDTLAVYSEHIQAILEEDEHYFSARNIALRYGLPAVIIFAVTIVGFYGLNPVTGWSLNKILVDADNRRWIADQTLEGARFGAVGAYIFVLLYLGQRAFQHDLSSGSVLWCAVTLAVGPMLAAAFSKVWITGTGGNEAQGWATQALYLAIGMSPRYTAQQITRLVQRLNSQTPRADALARAMPLSIIRGVTLHVEERLVEEGIDDVADLAMADPLRLQRSTNFDKRQILSWIDSALLMHALPESWDELEKMGIRGAMDLIWYAQPPKGQTDVPSSRLDALVGRAKNIANADILKDVAQRLGDDAQVQRIQMLYQLIDRKDAKAPEDNSLRTDAASQLQQTVVTAGPLPAVPGVPPALPGGALPVNGAEHTN